MKEIDAPLLTYIKPLIPDLHETIGFAVVDDETLRIWYFDEKKVKKQYLVKAPLSHEL